VILTHSRADFGNQARFDTPAPVLRGLKPMPAFVF
jgi:hypothetical protein